MNRNLIHFVIAIFFIISLQGCDNKTQKQPIQNIKWVEVPAQTCIDNGGESINGQCQSNWKIAEKVCSSLGARLPKIDELKSVIDECGGDVYDFEDNKNNPKFMECYKNKGFDISSNDYWSSFNNATATNYIPEANSSYKDYSIARYFQRLDGDDDRGGLADQALAFGNIRCVSVK